MDEIGQQGRWSSESIGVLKDDDIHSRLTILEKKLKDLERSVNRMEIHEANSTKEKTKNVLLKQNTTFLTVALYEGRSGECYIFRVLIISERLTCFQCLLLLIIATGFFWFGTTEFLSAMKSENSKWKPRTLRKIEDYSKEEIGAYNMPYFYLKFWISQMDYDKSNCSPYDYPTRNCSVDKVWTQNNKMNTFLDMWAPKPNWTCDQGCEAPIDRSEVGIIG